MPGKEIPSQGTTSPGSSNAISPTMTSYEICTRQERWPTMQATYFDVDQMLFAITNDLDGALILLLVECLELALLLPVIERANNNLGSW
jgi:hypothetical protein